MLDKLRRAFKAPDSPYSYVFGPNTLGIGVENAALVRPIPPIEGGGRYGRKYNVRGGIAPFTGAMQYPTAISGPMIDTRYNGAYLSGDLYLASLVGKAR